MKGIFVTGTDTGCGKTEVSLGLILALQERSLRVQAMKPVASGCGRGSDGLVNEDARRLRAQSSRKVPYELVNPYAFTPAIAPHIAAVREGVEIRLPVIRDRVRAQAAGSDLLVVEGVGGWRVPLSPHLFVSDLPRELGLAVVLVVGLRLGCVNHSLLTAEGICSAGCHLAGWIANQVDPGMEAGEENLASLKALIDAPLLGVVPWMIAPETRRVAQCLEVDGLLQRFGVGNGV